METLALFLQAAAEPAAEKTDAAPEVTEVPAPAAAEPAAPASDAAVATTEEVEEVPAPTRALDEVSGSTEEPDSKKAKVRSKRRDPWYTLHIQYGNTAVVSRRVAE